MPGEDIYIYPEARGRGVMAGEEVQTIEHEQGNPFQNVTVYDWVGLHPKSL